MGWGGRSLAETRRYMGGAREGDEKEAQDRTCGETRWGIRYRTFSPHTSWNFSVKHILEGTRAVDHFEFCGYERRYYRYLPMKDTF